MDMPMRSDVPDWLTPVAWTYITLSLVSAALIAVDIYLRRRRHDSLATELVWVTSALYLGPFAVLVYLSRGRANPATGVTGDDVADDGAPASATAVAVLPGGGASALAHLVAVPFVAAVGWTIAGMAMWAMIPVIAVLAIAMLTVYERLASRAGRLDGRTRGLTLGAAVVAAVITVAAFDIGMVGWMVLLHLNDLMPPVSDGTFWFLMQVGVIVGLVTGYPAVKWLVGSAPGLVDTRG